MRFASLSVSMVESAGSISPPNAAAVAIGLSYSPSVTLSWSDELLSGDVTTLARVTLTATFGSPMTSVTSADIEAAVTGATGMTFLQVDSKTCDAIPRLV